MQKVFIVGGTTFDHIVHLPQLPQPVPQTIHQDFIDAAQYIHLSSDKLPNYKTVMQQFIINGKKLVVCTHGKAGATLLTPAGEWIEQAALLHYPMVDANGAGDAFFSGFLFGWMNSEPLQKCMQLGAVCAALCIGSKQLWAKKLSAELLIEEWRKNF